MIKVSSGSNESVSEAVFIEDAMEIGTEDSGVRCDASIQMRLFVLRPASQLRKRPRLFEIKRFADMDLISAHMISRYRLSEKRGRDELASCDLGDFVGLHCGLNRQQSQARNAT